MIGTCLGANILDRRTLETAEVVTMRVWSDAFGENEAIPVKFIKDGYNTSPPFRWGDLPDGTRELALVFEGVI
jgi:phosphatidylethanolamine-binding protein (PEBP) family uncharacterized protein